MKKIWYNGVLLEFHARQYKHFVIYNQNVYDSIIEATESYLQIFKVLPLNINLNVFVGGVEITVLVSKIMFDYRSKFVMIYFE